MTLRFIKHSSRVAWMYSSCHCTGWQPQFGPKAAHRVHLESRIGPHSPMSCTVSAFRDPYGVKIAEFGPVCAPYGPSGTEATTGPIWQTSSNGCAIWSKIVHGDSQVPDHRPHAFFSFSNRPEADVHTKQIQTYAVVGVHSLIGG